MEQNIDELTQTNEYLTRVANAVYDRYNGCVRDYGMRFRKGTIVFLRAPKDSSFSMLRFHDTPAAPLLQKVDTKRARSSLHLTNVR